MNFVLFIERFDFLRPFLEIKNWLMVDGDRLALQIDIHALDLAILGTDIFNEFRAAFAVNTGDNYFGDRHNEKGGIIVWRGR